MGGGGGVGGGGAILPLKNGQKDWVELTVKFSFVKSYWYRCLLFSSCSFPRVEETDVQRVAIQCELAQEMKIRRLQKIIVFSVSSSKQFCANLKGMQNRNFTVKIFIPSVSLFLKNIISLHLFSLVRIGLQFNHKK